MSKLFDPKVMGYVVVEENFDRGDGKIYDQAGKVLGAMDQKLISLKKETKLLETDGTLAAVISKKVISIKPTYQLFDPNENLIAKLERKMGFKPKFELKDPKGKVLYWAKGNLRGFDFEVFQGKGKDVVAEIHKLDKWKDTFFTGKFDRKDSYGVKVHDAGIDRRLLIGLVITIDNVLHDS